MIGCALLVSAAGLESRGQSQPGESAAETAELQQQRLAAARKAAELADQIAQTGHSHSLFVRARVATRRYLVWASRDVLPPAEMEELLSGQVRQLRDLERAYEQQGGKGRAASRLDLLEIRYTRLGFELELRRVGNGRKPAGPAAQPAVERLQVAQQAYDLAGKEMGGRYDPAGFNNLLLWSRRWMQAQLAAADDDPQRMEALRAYLERSRKLESVFEKRRDTEAYGRNLAAAEAQRLEAEALIAEAQGHVDLVRERMDKRARDLHLVHKALALAAQVPDYGRFIEARAECFGAESAFLRAAGRMDLLVRCHFDYVRDMQDWEELARAQTQKRRDPKLELDLAIAQYARIAAMLAMEPKPDQQ